ncbi:MAG: hypothetical protein RIF32_21875 [Leptospirales bacterium]|jgi:hypothetical protein
MGAANTRGALQGVPLFSTGAIAVMLDGIDQLRNSGDDPEELVWRHAIGEGDLLLPESRAAIFEDPGYDFCIDSVIRLRDGSQVFISTLECRAITLIIPGPREGFANEA